MLAEDGILESQLGAEEVTDTNDIKDHPDRPKEGSGSGSCVEQEYYGQDQVKLIFSSCALYLRDMIRAFINSVLHKKKVFVMGAVVDIYLWR